MIPSGVLVSLLIILLFSLVSLQILLFFKQNVGLHPDTMDLPLILGRLQGSLRLLLVDKVSAENLHTHTNPSLSLDDR